jgi:hypothetical protein
MLLFKCHFPQRNTHVTVPTGVLICWFPGSGYLSAAMAKMVAPNGFVLGVDKVRQLRSLYDTAFAWSTEALRLAA